jgi:hypothetical protein
MHAIQNKRPLPTLTCAATSTLWGRLVSCVAYASNPCRRCRQCSSGAAKDHEKQAWLSVGAIARNFPHNLTHTVSPPPWPEIRGSHLRMSPCDHRQCAQSGGLSLPCRQRRRQHTVERQLSFMHSFSRTVPESNAILRTELLKFRHYAVFKKRQE